METTRGRIRSPLPPASPCLGFRAMTYPESKKVSSLVRPSIFTAFWVPFFLSQSYNVRMQGLGRARRNDVACQESACLSTLHVSKRVPSEDQQPTTC